MTKARATLDTYLTYGGFGRVEREVRFHPERKWRADWFLPDQVDPRSGAPSPVIIEYDGILHAGRNASHGSIAGVLRDAEKGNAAQALGYRFLRANAKSIEDGSFFRLLEAVLAKVETQP